MTGSRPVLTSVPRPGRAAGLEDDLDAHQMEASWGGQTRAGRFEPAPRATAWRWEWSALSALAHRSATARPPDSGGGHRVLGCANPGLRRGYRAAARGTTQSLWAGVECLMPGESTPAHRHSPSAVRFAVSGPPIWTTVNGERCLVAPGDVVVVPAWTWHDQVNEADEPAVWLNALDSPLTAYLEAEFFELHPFAVRQPVLGTHAGHRAWSAPGLAPHRLPAAVEASWLGGPDGVVAGPRTAVLRYPWPRTQAALELLRADGADRYEGVLVHFTDPLTGGAIGARMGAAMQLLPGGYASLPHRHVHSAVYQVLEGTGFSVIDGVRVDWAQGDVVALPPWAVHEHHAPRGDAVLFSVTDQPAVIALGLERIIELLQRQAVRASFTGKGQDGTD